MYPANHCKITAYELIAAQFDQSDLRIQKLLLQLTIGWLALQHTAKQANVHL